MQILTGKICDHEKRYAGHEWRARCVSGFGQG